MTKQDKLDKFKHIQEMISNLKANPSVNSKKTIQQLQQQLDEMDNNEIW
jgi:hypothetical protein